MKRRASVGRSPVGRPSVGRACRDPFGRAGVGRACRDLGLALVGIWLAAEAAHALADRGSPAPEPIGIGETLLVLGCPSRPDGPPSFRQRWRVSLAARNDRPTARLVFSGAHEAGVMAGLATSGYGIDPARVSCENEATNAWENIGCSAVMIAPGGVVRIVSDPLHARRGERYWRLRLPGRANELRPARLYRFGERPLCKVATAVYELLLRSLRYPTG